jgi:hypothetical protein
MLGLACANGDLAEGFIGILIRSAELIATSSELSNTFMPGLNRIC